MIELTLSGSPYERGLHHGRALAEQIAARVRKMPKLDNPDAWAIFDGVARHVDSLFPEINEEIRGIADGAGVSFVEALAYNNRSLLSAAAAEGCTALAVARGGRVVVGMNKDMPEPDPGGHFIRKCLPDSGYSSIGYGHVGRLWGYGVNEQGLCAAGTSARPRNDRIPIPAVGLYFMGPIAVNRCRTVQEAVDLVLGIGTLAESGNLLFADAGGDMAVVEVSPDKRVVRRPAMDAIFTTNHYASGDIEHTDDRAYVEESLARFARLDAMISQPGEVSLESVEAILRSHAAPAPICRHCSPGMSTLFSWIALPAERRFLMCEGNPCTGSYNLYGI